MPLASLNRDVITAQERAENAKPALTHEEARALGGRGNRKASANGTSFSRGSNNAATLTARIARDHPAILQRMKAGEFPSVRQAGIAAGIVKRATPLDALRKAWGVISSASSLAIWYMATARTGSGTFSLFAAS